MPIITKSPIVLGSSSKFRRSLLEAEGVQFTVIKPDIDEYAILVDPNVPRDRQPPEELVIKISEAKAQAIIGKVKASEDLKECIIITCDQVVTFNGAIREKPEDEQQAREYLHSYSRGPAVTNSAIVLTHYPSGKQVKGVDVAKQYFKSLSEEVINALIAKGDVYHCAGGFLIDDPIMFPYLGRREGEESSIIGLPRTLLIRLFEDMNNLLKE